MIVSKAKRMQATLRLLRHERGLIFDDAPVLPLLTPATGPMIVSGIASKASTRDFDGVVTVPHAFGELPLPSHCAWTTTTKPTLALSRASLMTPMARS